MTTITEMLRESPRTARNAGNSDFAGNLFDMHKFSTSPVKKLLDL